MSGLNDGLRRFAGGFRRERASGIRRLCRNGSVGIGRSAKSRFAGDGGGSGRVGGRFVALFLQFHAVAAHFLHQSSGDRRHGVLIGLPRGQREVFQYLIHHGASHSAAVVHQTRFAFHHQAAGFQFRVDCQFPVIRARAAALGVGQHVRNQSRIHGVDPHDQTTTIQKSPHTAIQKLFQHGGPVPVHRQPRSLFHRLAQQGDQIGAPGLENMGALLMNAEQDDGRGFAQGPAGFGQFGFGPGPAFLVAFGTGRIAQGGGLVEQSPRFARQGIPCLFRFGLDGRGLGPQASGLAFRFAQNIVAAPPGLEQQGAYALRGPGLDPFEVFLFGLLIPDLALSRVVQTFQRGFAVRGGPHENGAETGFFIRRGHRRHRLG